MLVLYVAQYSRLTGGHGDTSCANYLAVTKPGKEKDYYQLIHH